MLTSRVLKKFNQSFDVESQSAENCWFLKLPDPQSSQTPYNQEIVEASRVGCWKSNQQGTRPLYVSSGLYLYCHQQHDSSTVCLAAAQTGP